MNSTISTTSYAIIIVTRTLKVCMQKPEIRHAIKIIEIQSVLFNISNVHKATYI